MALPKRGAEGGAGRSWYGASAIAGSSRSKDEPGVGIVLESDRSSRSLVAACVG